MFDNFFRRIAIPTNISTYLSRTLIIITVAATFLIGGVLIFQQTLYFRKISDQKSEEFIDYQKSYIKEIVKNEISYIKIQNEVFKQEIKDKVRKNVNQAFFTAEFIYQKYKEQKSEEEIKSLIIATISSLKFETERDAVFISSLDGQGIYYRGKPEFSNKDLRDLKDANGSAVILEEIKLLESNSEGFLDYSIKHSETEERTPHQKIAFVKKFGHYNWYFGSKQYVDDYFPELKEEVAQKLSTVRFKHGGYIFMNNTNGTPIVMDGKIYHGSLNLITDTLDPRHEVFLKELDVINTQPEGGYFYYKWNKMGDTIPTEKCSYVEIFKEYNWIIGAGFYMDELNQSIKEQQQALRADQKKNIVIILFLFLFLLGMEAFIIYNFNKRYKADFDHFFNFFYASQNTLNKLNISDFYFEEFKRAGVAANNMIELRKEIEARLIEEQKRATESDRLKSAFLANMSHEIRTPMNAILGFSELLQDEQQDTKDKALFIQLIKKNGEILLNLINDIIDISKIEANLLTIKKKQINLNRFVIELENHYSGLISTKKENKVKFLCTSNIHEKDTIITDTVRLRQILDNLIGNAIKFTSSGEICVDVQQEGNIVRFSVSDTGIGISPDQQKIIFERFMQADPGNKKNYGGNGLGLAISKNLVELLGGEIHVESEPGNGSRFYFYISTT